MGPGKRPRQGVLARVGRPAVVGAAFLLVAMAGNPRVNADCACGKSWPHWRCAARLHRVAEHLPAPADLSNPEFGGTWYWVRSPEQERRVVMSLFNRYCIRCHGVDGRGVWDIPDVPDFTNTVWQASRPEQYRARVILEGRGAVMPSFRGVITLEEAFGLARYLHSFVPGHEVSRPGLGHDGSSGTPPTQTTVPPATAPTQAPIATPPPLPAPPPTTIPAPPSPSTPGPFHR